MLSEQESQNERRIYALLAQPTSQVEFFEVFSKSASDFWKVWTKLKRFLTRPWRTNKDLEKRNKKKDTNKSLDKIKKEMYTVSLPKSDFRTHSFVPFDLITKIKNDCINYEDEIFYTTNSCRIQPCILNHCNIQTSILTSDEPLNETRFAYSSKCKECLQAFCFDCKQITLTSSLFHRSTKKRITCFLIFKNTQEQNKTFSVAPKLTAAEVKRSVN